MLPITEASETVRREFEGKKIFQIFANILPNFFSIL